MKIFEIVEIAANWDRAKVLRGGGGGGEGGIRLQTPATQRNPRPIEIRFHGNPCNFVNIYEKYENQ